MSLRMLEMNFGCTSDSEPQPEKHLDTEMDETNGANVDLWELISHARRFALGGLPMHFETARR